MIHQLPSGDVVGALRSTPEGLTSEEAAHRLASLGPNVIEAARRFSWPKSLLAQFTHPFALLLVAAAIICFAAERLRPGESMAVLGWALLAVSVLNAVFGFVQTWRAERAMEALARFLPARSTVVRDGVEQSVDAAALVPGDLLLVAEGDRVPADARLIEAHGLLLDNAPLTGESRPVGATADPCVSVTGATSNIVFAGCGVLRGGGRAVVFATGSRTEFGRIATLSGDVEQGPTPLERETNHMVRVLTAVAVALGVAFFLYGLAVGRDLMVNLVFMMGIIVANVPEGLLPTFTLSLAMGSLRMARRNVLVRQLSAVEAIGAVQVVCTDKTGTLTRYCQELWIGAA